MEERDDGKEKSLQMWLNVLGISVKTITVSDWKQKVKINKKKVNKKWIIKVLDSEKHQKRSNLHRNNLVN